jgi:HK97 family phage prohead protease
MEETSSNGVGAVTVSVPDADDRAVWSTSYVNDLPDSAFLYIEPGGSKDGEGKTTPRTLRHFPVKDKDGKVDMPHVRNALSRIPQSNLPQSVKDLCTTKAQKMMSSEASAEPPRESVCRWQPDGGFDLITRSSRGGMPTLTGHFAVFDEWTEINSLFEGRFMEQFSQGAFAKTFQENRDRMRVLFQHGKDPQIGDKVLGAVDVLEEQERGAYYEVPLLDTSYNRDLIPGLEAGLYGASFRFRVVKEELNNKPEASDHNPDGIPERTVTEAKVMEFGPVTFPAYQGATAGVRSLPDEFIAGQMLSQFASDPERLRAVLESAGVRTNIEPEPPGATTHEPEPEPSAATTPVTRRFDSREEWERWISLQTWMA